ncbi:ABA4-like family protein [Aestuariivirga sp.]|uniref:ABA4-like family protein n=1 Tax=Aestuariivirga sp. TaxID=2650926 RepID=UPI0035939C24
MTPDSLFAVSGPIALAGWLALAAGIVFDRPFLRDRVAGLLIPLLLSAAYTVLILIFWWTADGGFGSLAEVQTLFTQGWVALAGWVHYLAYDLFIGAFVSRQIMERKLSRLFLVPILPLTFLFGPIGFLLAQGLLLTRIGDAS